MWVPEAVWMSTSRRAEKVGRNPGRVLHLTREPPSLVLSARGGPPGQEQPGSQLEARRLPQTKRGGAGGVFLLPTPSGESKAITPGPLSQSASPSLRDMENHSAFQDTVTSSGLSIAQAHSQQQASPRSLKYRGPWKELDPVPQFRGKLWAMHLPLAKPPAPSAEPPTQVGLPQSPTHILAFAE